MRHWRDPVCKFLVKSRTFKRGALLKALAWGSGEHPTLPADRVGLEYMINFFQGLLPYYLADLSQGATLHP